MDEARWLQSGEICVPDEFLYRGELDGVAGPWVAVSAWLDIKDEASGKEVSGRLAALLVNAADEDRLQKVLLASGGPAGGQFPEVPTDYSTFAGEIPWSPVFGCEADEGGELYRGFVASNSGTDVEVEALAHAYLWEAYHSRLNDAGGALVPSRTISVALDLRGVPQSFDQVELDGRLASKSFSAPSGFTGHLLYLRADLLQRYAEGRRLVWWIGGDRSLTHPRSVLSTQLAEIYKQGGNEWCVVRRGESLCSTLASNNS